MFHFLILSQNPLNPGIPKKTAVLLGNGNTLSGRLSQINTHMINKNNTKKKPAKWRALPKWPP